MKVKLTRAVVDQLQPSASQRFVWDTTLRGFGVRVAPGGAKAFILQRSINGGTRRITIGRADDMGPDHARRLAEKLAAQFAAGVDPVAERKKQERAALTLRQAFADYVAAPTVRGTSKGAPKKPKTKRDIEKHVAKNFADWLDLPVSEIKPSMVQRKQKELQDRAPRRPTSPCDTSGRP
jgi:Arm DNA-binding domain